MRPLLLPILLLLASVCLCQDQDKAHTPPYEKAVQWVVIRVPTFPPLARTARILGTVAIEIRFKGCALDPKSPHVVSGRPILNEAALKSLKQSTVLCGDFPNSTATVYYDFADYNRPACDSGYTRVEVAGSRVRVMTTPACIQ